MLDFLVDQNSIDLSKDVLDDVRHLIAASHAESPVSPRSGAAGGRAEGLRGRRRSAPPSRRTSAS